MQSFSLIFFGYFYLELGNLYKKQDSDFLGALSDIFVMPRSFPQRELLQRSLLQ